MKRILIVDDDAAISRSLSLLLSERFEVTVASSGLSAIHELTKAAFDLVLLDLRMPGLNGAEFVDITNGAPNTPPIIVISAKESAQEEAQELGLEVVLKPIDMDELSRKIDRLMGTKPAPRRREVRRSKESPSPRPRRQPS